MSILVRAIRYLFYFLALIIGLIILLLGTEFGSRTTLSIVNSMFEEQLHVENIEGVLLRDFELQQISFTGPAQKVTAERLRIRWRPWQLLKRELQVRALELAHVHVEVSNSESSESAEFVLGHYAFPGRLRLDRFYLQNASLQMNGRLTVINEITARARWEQDELRLNHLFVAHDLGTARLLGNVTLSDDYPLELSLHVETTHEQTGPLVAELDLDGALRKTMQFDARTTGQVALQAQGTLSNVFDMQMQWQVSSTVHARELEIFDAYTDAISLQFNGNGGRDFAYGELLVSTVLNDYGLVTFETTGRFEQEQAQLESLELLASELGLEFNLTGRGNVTAQSQSASMQGILHYQELPQINVAIDWDGTPVSADSFQVQLESELGALSMSGSAEWTEQLSWNISLNTQQLEVEKLITPLQHYLSNLPEKWGEHLSISGQLHTEGRLSTANDGPRFTLNSEAFKLSTGSRQIDTALSLNYAEQTLAIERFSARAAESRITVTGSLGKEQLNLTGEIYSADLSQLHSDLKGRLDLDLKATGALRTPLIEVQAQGDYLAWADYAIATLRTDFKLDLSFQQLPVGAIEALGVSGLQPLIAPNEPNLPPLNINVVSQHTEQFALSFAVTNDQLNISSQLLGEGTAENFTGQLQELLIKLPSIGIWQAEQTNVAWQNLGSDARTFRFQDFCLVRNTRETSICGELSWSEAERYAKLEMRNMNLNTITPWLPETVRADGFFSVYGEYQEQQGARQYQGRSEISDVRVSLPDQDVTLWFDAGEVISMQGDSDRLSGRLRLTASDVDGRVTADFAIAEPFQTPTLQSNVDLSFADLQIVSIVAPQLQNVSGQLQGVFGLSGPLTRPQIDGFIELTNGSAEVPAAGIRLEALNARIRSPENPDSTFSMQASAQSAGGSLEISGDYLLATHTANFDIKGSRFEAMRTRDLQLRVSPDLALRVAPQRLTLRGSVLIPEARISPPEFDTVVRSSPDTVVIRNEDTVWQNTRQSPYDIDIQLNLGEQFNVSAYGFEGRLNGGLRIIEQPNQQTTAIGNINVATGQYELYGQQLTVERGTLVYSGGVISNPGLDLRVSRQFEMEQVNVGARVGGTLRTPRLTLFSTPTMQDAEILSYLVLGRGFSEENAEDQNLFLQASLALGMQGGNILGERLSNTLGVDEIVLDGGDTLESTALYIGKQLSPRLYVRYGVGLVEPVSTFFIRYRLTDYLNFETQTGTQGSGADLFYTIER